MYYAYIYIYIYIYRERERDLSEEVHHEVFGPWVRWERGQVIPGLSQRRTVVVGPKMEPNSPKTGSFVFRHIEEFTASSCSQIVGTDVPHLFRSNNISKKMALEHLGKNDQTRTTIKFC